MFWVFLLILVYSLDYSKRVGNFELQVGTQPVNWVRHGVMGLHNDFYSDSGWRCPVLGREGFPMGKCMVQILGYIIEASHLCVHYKA